MKFRRNSAYFATSLACASLGSLNTGAAAQAGPPIRVVVNGAPIAFEGTPPTEIQGAVLVPLRGVFQALGAGVNYNGVTRVINAQKGSTTVVLPLGSTTATVNGQSETLSQPAQSIGGTTLVPLRFVAQALGAYVQWDAASQTVEIKTDEPHLAALPTPQGRGPVIGQATGVYRDTNPQQITIRVNGVDTSIPLTPTTIVLRTTPGQPATEVGLNQIQPGDQVTVQRDESGAALSITATYGEVRGTIKSISGKLPDGDQILTLNDGVAVELVPDAPVTMAGRRASLSDVMANEEVVIRTNPSNKMGFGVAVVTPDNPNPTPPGRQRQQQATPSVTSFTDNAHGPLKQGDQIQATLAGTPGGKASFTIPGVVESVPMLESSPGVYTGSYTVPRGLDVNGAAVLGQVTAGGASSPLVQAADLVTIKSVPPKPIAAPVVAGPPQPPVITSPTARATIHNSVTIQGKAAPGATVRVTVDYVSKPLGGLFSINGSAGTRDVMADRSGNWQVADLPLQTNSLIGNYPNTVFTISAVTVAPGGRTSDAATVSVPAG